MLTLPPLVHKMFSRKPIIYMEEYDPVRTKDFRTSKSAHIITFTIKFVHLSQNCQVMCKFI